MTTKTSATATGIIQCGSIRTTMLGTRLDDDGKWKIRTNINSRPDRMAFAMIDEKKRDGTPVKKFLGVFTPMAVHLEAPGVQSNLFDADQFETLSKRIGQMHPTSRVYYKLEVALVELNMAQSEAAARGFQARVKAAETQKQCAVKARFEELKAQAAEVGLMVAGGLIPIGTGKIKQAKK